MTKKAKKLSGLKGSKKQKLLAFNDIYIVMEDPLETVYDTGLKKSTTDAIKSGLIILPDSLKNFSEKYPCRGTVISKGEKTRYPIKVGDKIVYARMGVQRYEFHGDMVCDVRECDIHALLEEK